MKNKQHFHKVNLKINGMHCASCEVLIERKFKKVVGVEKVSVSHTNGQAELYCSINPDLNQLNASIKDHGYTVSQSSKKGTFLAQNKEYKNTAKDYFQIGVVFLIVVAGYLVFKQLGLVPSLGISDNMSYGFVFLIGVVAATSTCLAVTGGLLLSVAAKYNEQNLHLDGWGKFKPTLYFNIGRVVSYTILGGLVGALGSVLTLSPRVNGIVTIIASAVMIILGLQLLKIFPWAYRFQPKMPKFLGHKVHDISDSNSKAAPFLLGAGTFFLPCGFTQALQLYVLSKGDPMTGTLTMLAFSLGTLPALLSLSALSSFIKGAFQQHFLRFAGVVVVLLGIFNVNNGLTLTGINFAFAAGPKTGSVLAATDPNVKIVGGKQIVNMKVTGLNYSPHTFTVVKGVPVEWRIDGTQAEGCAQVITVPSLGITEYLSQQTEKVITFTPQSTGQIPFSCTMGMTTRGSAFTVVENTQGIQPAKTSGAVSGANTTTGCNSEIMNCVEAQKISLEVSRERGVYPQLLTVKKNVPVELTVNSQVPLGGCMSVWVIPKYNVTIPMKVGTTTANFTPTETGTLDIACSMGSRMAQIQVTE